MSVAAYVNAIVGFFLVFTCFLFFILMTVFLLMYMFAPRAFGRVVSKVPKTIKAMVHRRYDQYVDTTVVEPAAMTLRQQYRGSHIFYEGEDQYVQSLYVTYEDTSATNINHVKEWLVNLGCPCDPQPDVDQDEVGLILNTSSRSSDWHQADKWYCCKVVKMQDCSDLSIVKIYLRKDGIEQPAQDPYTQVFHHVSIEEFKKALKISNVPSV